MLAALKSERVVDMSDMEMQLEAAPQENREGRPYLGSVAFYKHVILFCVFLLFVLLTGTVIFFSAHYVSLKKDYAAVCEEYRTVSQERDDYKKQFAAAAAESGRVLKDETSKTDVVRGDFSMPFHADPEDWRYLLINEAHPLNPEYTVKLAPTRNGQFVDQRIVYQLEKMIDDAAKEGYSLIICSSYRDYERQNELQKESISQYMDKGLSYHDAFFRVKRTLALTGTSEHHTGLSVDIVGEDYQCLDEEQAKRPEAIWLAEHCAEYGFVVRYDRGKEDITGMDYESWHFRYVGKEAAAFMEEYDLCLEEFSDMVEFFHRPDESE